MQTTFERNISAALNEHSQIDLAVDHLLRIWKDRGCSAEDTFTLFQFLSAKGYQLTLCSQIHFLLDKKLPIPWLFVLDVYETHKDLLNFTSKEFLDNLFTAANDNSIKTILKYTKYDYLDPRFERLRSEWISRELEEKHLRKKELLTKLLLLKNERLIEEERKLFQTALEEFPTDEELLQRYNDFQIRYADSIFQKSETKKHPFWVKILRKEPSSKEDPYVKEMLRLAKKYPAERYWIASSLFLSECYSSCIDLLSKKPNSFEEKWLLLEAYIQDQQFVLALEYARDLEEEVKDSPENLMSCLYHQAICLKQLGKKAEALQILKSILSHSKNFKMAQYLFDHWSST